MGCFRRLWRKTNSFSLSALALCYFCANYAFASLTAHISALYPGFLGAALALGVPAALAAWTLAFLLNLKAGLTHYGTGSAPVYFAGAYVSQNPWWAVGFVVSIVNIAIRLGLGSLWWSLISTSLARFGVDDAMVELDDAPANGQSQAAARFGGRFWINSDETLENSFLLFHSDSRTSVAPRSRPLMRSCTASRALKINTGSLNPLRRHSRRTQTRRHRAGQGRGR